MVAPSTASQESSGDLLSSFPPVDCFHSPFLILVVVTSNVVRLSTDTAGRKCRYSQTSFIHSNTPYKYSITLCHIDHTMEMYLNASCPKKTFILFHLPSDSRSRSSAHPCFRNRIDLTCIHIARAIVVIPISAIVIYLGQRRSAALFTISM